MRWKTKKKKIPSLEDEQKKLVANIMATDNPANASFEMNPTDYEALQQLPGNKICVDCGDSSVGQPDWGCPKFGVFFCFECSGEHRGLGTHISFVRSVRMDQWATSQLAYMKAGGNERFQKFMKERGYDTVNLEIRETYDNPAAQFYKQVLRCRVEGLPAPTEPTNTAISADKQQLNTPSSSAKLLARRKMEGFGSAPPPQEESATLKNAAFLAAPVAVLAIGWAFSAIY